MHNHGNAHIARNTANLATVTPLSTGMLAQETQQMWPWQRNLTIAELGGMENLRMEEVGGEGNEMLPVAAAAGGLAHGDAGLAGAHLADELIGRLQQGLAGQGSGSACGSGGHGWKSFHNGLL